MEYFNLPIDGRISRSATVIAKQGRKDKEGNSFEQAEATSILISPSPSSTEHQLPPFDFRVLHFQCKSHRSADLPPVQTNKQKLITS